MPSQNDLVRVAEKVRAFKEGRSKDMPTTEELTYLGRRGNFNNQQNDKPTDNVGMNDVDKYIDDLLGAGGSSRTSAAPIPADRPTEINSGIDVSDGSQGLPIQGDIPIPAQNPRLASEQDGSSIPAILASLLGVGGAAVIGKKLYDRYGKRIAGSVQEGIDASLGEVDEQGKAMVADDGTKGTVRPDAAAPVNNIDDGINQQLEGPGNTNTDAGQTEQLRSSKLEEIVEKLKGKTPEDAVQSMRDLGYDINPDVIKRMAKEGVIPADIAARILKKVKF